ncbi:MAG TPA: flagellar hook protein FlgE [Phenylobacterium sp.]|uniref:flagellar hook protein FlgE n=1 Tax=Phenylobacterium sp. TaxID=1871053 RepID=UPI002B482CD7|nr:flagellar hook protein FlgE [Phenylobacterium sp.]HKR89883.1 flagellar hook protein FlgE [Phenylobacterium sp.]
MSLSSALSSAVSGLNAQSVALSNISKNIANASTTAYKTSQTDFETMLTGSTGADVAGGVTATTMQNMSQQGQIASTSTATNVAIQGDGFFVVGSSANSTASDLNYTRDGSFTKDSAGNLVNDAGDYLMGFATDSSGSVIVANTSDLSNLQPINLSKIGGTAKATSEINFTANLPATATVGASFATSTTMIDSLGVSHTIGQTWTKTAANTWTLALADPVETSDISGGPSGTISPSTVDVTFDSNGVLTSTNPSPVDLSITGLTTGAADSNITLNLGTVGKTDGVTQFASTTSTIGIENPTFTQDGALYGQLTGVTIDGKGLITASFDNGVKLPVYQIPVATFANPNGLTPISGTTYGSNQAAGNVGLRMPGDGGAGSLVASALEGSTTDIASEFNRMIVAQQAYSAASQVVTTVKSMFDTLTQAMR